MQTSFQMIVKPVSGLWSHAYETVIRLARHHFKRLWFSFSGQIRRRDHIRNEVAAVSSRLRSAMADVEPAFLNIGQMLQDIHQDAARLTDMVSRTETADGGEKGSMDIAHVGNFARQVSSGLTDCREAIMRRLDILDQGEKNLTALYRACENTEKLSLLLNVIKLNMAVESNRSVSAKTMFEVFVKEVGGLAEKIGRIANQLYKDAKSACMSQQGYRSDIAFHFDELSVLADDAQCAADTAVKEVARIMTQSLTDLEKARSVSRAIANQIREIVVAVQFHDIVRQQLEHVLLGFEDISTIMNDASQDQFEGRLHLSLKIQHAQIEAAISEVNGAHETISRAFDAIDIQVNDLMTCTADSVAGHDAESNGGKNSFQTVLSCLSQLNRLTGDASTLNDRMEGIAEEASHKSAALLKYVDEVQHVSLELHRKALNAIIKAAHLGEMGRAFEVLAQEVTSTADASAAFADQVSMMVSAVADQADLLKQEDTQAGTDSGVDRETLYRSLEAGMEDISNIFLVWQENGQAAFAMADKLAQSIALARDALSFISLFRKNLEESLAGCGSMLDRYTTDVHIKDGIMEGVNGTKTRYTMESERLLHEKIMNRAEGPPLPDESPPDTGVDKKDKKDGDDAIPPGHEDDLGDNVDLF